MRNGGMFSVVTAVSVAIAVAGGQCDHQERQTGMSEPKVTQAAAIEQTSDSGPHQKATFAAGCFWGVEHTFRQIDGVIETSVGYTGGRVENPTYKQVCTDKTGHAEAVQVIFNPSKVGYEDLLALFWECHDPTQVNRQGPDYGTQYRSAIFFHDEQQKKAAVLSRHRLEESGRYNRPIATQIVPAQAYYPAEEYHQQYLEKRGAPSCHR